MSDPVFRPTSDSASMRSVATQKLRDVTGWRLPFLFAVMLAGPPLMALTFSSIAPVLPAIGHHFSTLHSFSGDGATFAQWVMTAPAIGLMLGGASWWYSARSGGATFPNCRGVPSFRPGRFCGPLSQQCFCASCLPFSSRPCRQHRRCNRDLAHRGTLR